MGCASALPQLCDLPALLSTYRWDDYHTAFGWPPDCLDTGFPWLVSLEDRFQAAMDRDELPPLSLVTEMILWGGNQNNVLSRFSKGVSAWGYEQCMSRVIDSLDDPSRAIDAVMDISGFGLTYGSKLLRFCCPQEYGALDGRIRKALEKDLGGPTSYAPTVQKQYVTFLGLLHKCRQDLHTTGVQRPAYGPRAASIDWTAAEIEMALFAWASSR